MGGGVGKLEGGGGGSRQFWSRYGVKCEEISFNSSVVTEGGHISQIDCGDGRATPDTCEENLTEEREDSTASTRAKDLQINRSLSQVCCSDWELPSSWSPWSPVTCNDWELPLPQESLKGWIQPYMEPGGTKG